MATHTDHAPTVHKPLNPKHATKATLARMRGVSRSAIGKLCRVGAFLNPAITADGLVDLSHPAVIRYLASDVGERLRGDSLPHYEKPQRTDRVLDLLERIAIGLDRIGCALEQRR